MKILRTLCSTIRAHSAIALAAWSVFLPLAGAVGGQYVGDYFKYSEEKRAAIRSDYDKNKEVQAALAVYIQKFSNKALGAASTTADDAQSLKTAVMAAFRNASQLQGRLPRLEPEFQRLSDALVALQNSALEMTGPADAKTFVRSTILYLDAQEVFNERVIALQQTWLASR